MKLSATPLKFVHSLILILLSQTVSSCCHSRLTRDTPSAQAFEIHLPQGNDQLGIFDPSIADTPPSTRVWMSYSAVYPSPRWPMKNTRTVTTRLAYSDDQGKTWSDSGFRVNDLKEVELPGLFNKSGSWNSEVSSLVYDASAVPSKRWKLFWHHYLWVNDKPQFENGWIAYKEAATPADLKAAPEIKLLGAKAYQSVNDKTTDKTGSPVAGPPIHKGDALHPSLNQCIVFTEPGAMVTSAGIYLSLDCFEPHFLGAKSKIIILKCASPCDPMADNAWAFAGTVLSDEDARRVGADRFSASDLFQDGNNNYLVVSPVTDQPISGAYNGCLVFQFANIDEGMLQKDAGGNLVVKSINGTPRSFNGACTFRHSASESGFLFSEIRFEDKPKFHIFATKQSL